MYAYHFDESSMRGSPLDKERLRGSFDHREGDERERARDRERDRDRLAGRKSLPSAGQSYQALPKEEQGEDAGGGTAAEKKAKACLGCRRSKVG